MKISDVARLNPALLILTINLAVICTVPSLSAQGLNKRHYLMDGNMAPGLAAQSFLVADPTLIHHVQPVRVVLPQGTLLEVGSGTGEYTAVIPKATMGMMIGPVYRFRVANLPDYPGKELYPSIEILGRLHPPVGMEHRFPIEIHLDQGDLEVALRGSLVTKVIYLEDPDVSFPQRHREGEQPTIDISIHEDPLRAAESLGRPMAIVRIGSRVPTYQANDQGFHFNAFAPTMLSHEEIDAPQRLDGNSSIHSIR